jgi:hypothetical protein
MTEKEIRRTIRFYKRRGWCYFGIASYLYHRAEGAING